MSFAVMVTCVRTTDVAAVEAAFGRDKYHRVEATDGPFVLVWELHEFNPELYHHRALKASGQFGEAFYVGTDSVVPCAAYSHCIDGTVVRAFFYMNADGELLFDEVGAREDWEDASHVPRAGGSPPRYCSAFEDVLRRLGCPTHPRSPTSSA